MLDRERLKENLNAVRCTMARACKSSGRSMDEVRLMAVTKTVSAEIVDALGECGLRCFGENRAHVGVPKAQETSVPGAEWHFIGNLQRRKVKSILPVFSWIHSLDSIALADEIQKQAAAQKIKTNVLVEVKTSHEASKNGLSDPESIRLIKHIILQPNLILQGLMTMAPLLPEAESSRDYFRALSALQKRVQEETGLALPELSMGMSNDYSVAIEEGATIIRVGTALFQGVYLEKVTT